MDLPKHFSGYERPALTAVMVAVALLATTWMGYADGGYFVRDWAPVVFLLAGLILVASLAGVFHAVGSRWGTAALGLFAGYAAWTWISLLWSPNKGDAWLGAGQTLLYLLVFGIAVVLLARGSSRRWVLAASVLGPAIVAAFTLATLVPDTEELFENYRLVGTVGYYNGEAAFLLAPFWVAVYLAGSRRVNPVLRGLVLAGATLSMEVAILTQSRGALVAIGVSCLVFFVFSGQRLRGLLALVPIAVALLVSLQNLNEVYLAFLNEENPAAGLNRVGPIIWLSSSVACVYGLVWGLIDRRWKPSSALTRAFGGAALVVFVAVSIFGAVTFVDRVGDPIAWAAQRWEAFKTDDLTGQEQSRYLSSSGSGRYIFWRVAWEDFVSHPLLGVGTHNYEATYYQLRERMAEPYVRQPHTLQLEVLGERGIVGGVLFFGFLTTCLAAGLWQRFKHLNAEGKALVGATIAAISYWFVHSSADWFWQIPAVTLPAMVYLATLVAPWSGEEPASARWSLRAIGAGIAVLAVAVVTPLYIADRYLAQSYAIANPWMALEAAERAQRFNPVNPQPAQREAELRMQIGDWPRVEQAYDKAIGLNPEHYAPYTLLARFYEQRGETGEALSSYREALALNPLDEELNQSVRRLEGRVDEEG